MGTINTRACLRRAAPRHAPPGGGYAARLPQLAQPDCCLPAHPATLTQPASAFPGVRPPACLVRLPTCLSQHHQALNTASRCRSYKLQAAKCDTGRESQKGRLAGALPCWGLPYHVSRLHKLPWMEVDPHHFSHISMYSLVYGALLT